MSKVNKMKYISNKLEEAVNVSEFDKLSEFNSSAYKSEY